MTTRSYVALSKSPRKKIAIDFVVAFCAMVLLSGTSYAETLHIHGGKSGRIQLAQSYCGQCNDARTACITKCNGSGTCIQKCDDDYETCREQNFCRGRR